MTRGSFLRTIQRLIMCSVLGIAMTAMLLLALIAGAPRHAVGHVAADLNARVEGPLVSPTLHSIVPTQVVIGSPGLVLTLTGANFTSTQPLSIEFGVSGEYPTTFVNSSTLAGFIPAIWFSQTQTSGYAVNLVNESGESSQEQLFFVTEAPQAAPVLTSIQPTRTHTRSQPLTLTLSGASFKNTDGLKVEFGGESNRFEPTIVDTRTLLVSIPGALLETAQVVDVAIINKSNQKSEMRKFTIDDQNSLQRLPIVMNKYNPPPPPCNQEAVDCFEPNNSFGSAAPLALSTGITAFAKPGDPLDDFYTVTLKSGKDVIITLAGIDVDSANRDLDLFLYAGPAPDYKKPIAASDRVATSRESITYRITSDGVYYVLVYAYKVTQDTKYTLLVRQP